MTRAYVILLLAVLLSAGCATLPAGEGSGDSGSVKFGSGDELMVLILENRKAMEAMMEEAQEAKWAAENAMRKAEESQKKSMMREQMMSDDTRGEMMMEMMMGKKMMGGNAMMQDMKEMRSMMAEMMKMMHQKGMMSNSDMDQMMMEMQNMEQ